VAGLGVGFAFGKRAPRLIGIPERNQQVSFLVKQEQVAVGAVVFMNEVETLHPLILELVNRHFLNTRMQLCPLSHSSVQDAST
jgi:hypothetical protein